MRMGSNRVVMAGHSRERASSPASALESTAHPTRSPSRNSPAPLRAQRWRAALTIINTGPRAWPCRDALGAGLLATKRCVGRIRRPVAAESLGRLRHGGRLWSNCYFNRFWPAAASRRRIVAFDPQQPYTKFGSGPSIWPGRQALLGSAMGHSARLSTTLCSTTHNKPRRSGASAGAECGRADNSWPRDLIEASGGSQPRHCTEDFGSSSTPLRGPVGR